MKLIAFAALAAVFLCATQAQAGLICDNDGRCVASVGPVKVRHASHKNSSRSAARHSGHRVATRSQPDAVAPAFDPVHDNGPTAVLLAVAKSQIGNGAVYGRSDLWCARFMNYVLERAGYHGTGSDMAESFAHWGHRVRRPFIGAIAVMSRGRRGGHVGIVSGFDADGDPIIISGNHGDEVRETAYPRSRIYAYQEP